MKGHLHVTGEIVVQLHGVLCWKSLLVSQLPNHFHPLISFLESYCII